MQSQKVIREFLNYTSLNIIGYSNNKIDKISDSILNILERMPNITVFYFKVNDCINYIYIFRI